MAFRSPSAWSASETADCRVAAMSMLSVHLGQNAPMTTAYTRESTNQERATSHSFFKAHDAQLVRPVMLTEHYSVYGPTTCSLELQQLAESFVQLTDSRFSTAA